MSSPEPPPFSDKDKIKVLLWCDRHCCLCGRACDTNIVVHHIRQQGRHLSNIENAIPLCFDCHGRVRSYSPRHPVGTSYEERELKARRDQVYDTYTQRFVPLITFNIDQGSENDPRPLPKVITFVTHTGNPPLPVRALVEVKHVLAGRDLGFLEDRQGYYSGRTPWHLNPGVMVFGNFGVPTECQQSNEDLKIETRVTIIDRYERPHMLLPQAWTYVRPRPTEPRAGNYWFLEPRSYTVWRLQPHFLRK